jgi:hypothetical protein
MGTEELAKLMAQVEEKGIGWDEVKEKAKISHDLLKLYVKSGPVPVTLIKSLEKILEEANA